MAHFMHMVLDGLQRYSDRPLIRPYTGSGKEHSWGLVTYADFLCDLEKAAMHWQKTLRSAGLQDGDVVGIWLTGEHVTDLVHLYGLARAGFTPELFSLKFCLPGQAVVRDLLAECHGKALLYDPAFAALVGDIACPAYPLADVAALPAAAALLPLPDVAPDDVAIVFHTSGTTGGRPKPVPQSHRWCRAHATVCWSGIWQGTYDSPDVVNNIGSFAHMGASTYVYKSAFTGGSFVQTPHSDIGAEEFLAMVRECGLNRLLQYGSWLSALVRVARENQEVLKAMQGLRQVVYTGVAMNPEDEKWGLENGIPITNLYGTTETAQCMVSELGSKSSLFRPIPGLGLRLVPAARSSDGATELYDLFLPLAAPNCPHSSVRNRPDGHVTGDLFEEVEPGRYAFRGRSDDWIKTGPTRAAFCDTKAAEDNVLRTCADLVRSCVVVGHLRPCVVLLVEPAADRAHVAADELKRLVLARTAAYNSRLLEHERITRPDRVLVVPPGSLPRTEEKGNIRRKAAHEQFAAQLAAIWGDAE